MVDQVVLTDSINESSYMAGASARTLFKGGAANGAGAVIFQFFWLDTTLAIVLVFEAVLTIGLSALLTATIGVNTEAGVTHKTSRG
jgi:hypothetical protein